MTQVTMYCHLGSQQGRVPMQVQTGRPDNERGVEERDPTEHKCNNQPSQN